MKTLALFAVLALASSVNAGNPTLTSITQPLYFLGSAADAKIQFIKVPKILNNSSAMFWIGLFSSPTEARGSDGDLNLISMYGITVEMEAEDQDGRPTVITIDATKASKPERYPLSIEEVLKAAEQTVRIEFPNRAKTTIKFKSAKDAATENAK